MPAYELIKRTFFLALTSCDILIISW